VGVNTPIIIHIENIADVMINTSAKCEQYANIKIDKRASIDTLLTPTVHVVYVFIV
jgi:hypothetical protein